MVILVYQRVYPTTRHARLRWKGIRNCLSNTGSDTTIQNHSTEQRLKPVHYLCIILYFSVLSLNFMLYTMEIDRTNMNEYQSNCAESLDGTIYGSLILFWYGNPMVSPLPTDYCIITSMNRWPFERGYPHVQTNLYWFNEFQWSMIA